MAFTFANCQGNNSTSSSNLTTANWSASSGNTVVAVIAMFNQTVNAVTDVNGLSFTITSVVNTPGGGHVYLAYATSISSNASYHVNVTTTGGPNELSIAAAEFAPPAGNTVSLETINSGSGTSGTPSISLTSVSAGDLVIGGASWDNTRAPTAGTGFTLPTNGAQPSTGDAGTHQPVAIEYQLSASAGTVAVAMRTGNGFGMWAAAFLATPSGGGGVIKSQSSGSGAVWSWTI